MEKRGIGIRGQGLSLTYIVLIVIFIAVAVVVIVGFTKGFDFIFGKTDILPGSLQAKIKACELADQNDLRADYCFEFDEVEISGKEAYVNCGYLVKEGFMSKGIKISECADEQARQKEFCVNKNLRDGVEVNGNSCKDLKEDTVS